MFKGVTLVCLVSLVLSTYISQTSTIPQINIPQISFNFPTQKFARAGQAFMRMQGPVLPQSQTVTNLSYDKTSTFAGFSNSFKSEMAYLIASIKELNTTQGKMLSDKLTIDLISIDNTMNRIKMNPMSEYALKPLLQFQVQQFLSGIDMIHKYVTNKKSPTVLGDNNVLYGQTGTIFGTNNAVVGNNNHVVGGSNTLVGNASIVSGFNNGMIGNNGVTVGTNNSVQASNSYVFSTNDVVTKNNALVVGNHEIDLGALGIYVR